MNRPWKLFTALPALIGLGIVVAFLVRAPRVDLIVDNGLAAPIRVELHGAPVGDVQPGETLRVAGVASGKLELAAAELAGEGRRFTLSEEAPAPRFGERRVYVWNVAGATSRYWIHWQGYGDLEGEHPDPQEFRPERHLFALPAGLQPTLDVPHPKELRVPAGTTGAVSQALFSEHFVEAYHREEATQQRLHQLAEEAAARQQREAEETEEPGGGRGPAEAPVGPPVR